jgi:hypothetical protein
MSDLHQYDGLWSIDIPTISSDEKADLFRGLLNRIKTKVYTGSGVDGLLLVIVDSQTVNNYDPIHKVYADDILAYICKAELTDQLLDLMLEQLSDMFITGRCPQGRTTRLYQIYKIS